MELVLVSVVDRTMIGTKITVWQEEIFNLFVNCKFGSYINL